MCSTMGIKEAPQNTIWIRDETGKIDPFSCLLSTFEEYCAALFAEDETKHAP